MRHKSTRQVYAMKLLSKYEMVSVSSGPYEEMDPLCLSVQHLEQTKNKKKVMKGFFVCLSFKSPLDFISSRQLLFIELCTTCTSLPLCTLRINSWPGFTLMRVLYTCQRCCSIVYTQPATGVSVTWYPWPLVEPYSVSFQNLLNQWYFLLRAGLFESSSSG